MKVPLTMSEIIFHPRESLIRLDEARPGWGDVPRSAWAWLSAVAVIDSLIYGASVAVVIPGLPMAGCAVWLAAASGLAWCLFGPALIAASRRGAIVCAHACLVTMLYGEMVLQGGASINAAMHLLGMPRWFDAVSFNVICVGCSNVVMATALAAQLKAIGVPRRRTFAAWLIVLNGAGGVLAYLLRFLLGTRPAV